MFDFLQRIKTTLNNLWGTMTGEQTERKAEPLRVQKPIAQAPQEQVPIQMPAPTPTVMPQTPQEFRDIIYQSSTPQITPDVLSAVLARESMNWNPDVISGNLNSPAGAQGVAQFMPQTVKELARLGFNEGVPFDPNDPDMAVKAAAFYLQNLFDRFGTLPVALAGYNAGPGAVDQYGGIPPYPETQNYVSEILKQIGR